jgi:hypothetical protein
MKRYTCVLTLLAVVLASLALPITARAAESYRFRGKTAYASSYASDPTTCISTSLYVFATEDRFQDSPGAPTHSAVAYASVFQWNECTLQTVACVYGSVLLPDGAFNMTGNLASATLTVTIPGSDCFSGDPSSLSVALQWSGEGDVFRGNSHSTYHYPGNLVSYRSSGQFRDAVPTGSVTFGDTALTFENGEIYGALEVTSSGSIYSSR